MELAVPAPVATLNDTDKMYFAVARKDVAGISYVHTLVSNRYRKTQSYDMIPHTEVNAFQTPTAADVFAGTVRQIIEIQKTKFPAYMAFVNSLRSEIAAFNAHTR